MHHLGSRHISTFGTYASFRAELMGSFINPIVSLLLSLIDECDGAE